MRLRKVSPDEIESFSAFLPKARRYGVKILDLATLKERLSEVQMNEKILRDRFKTELAALKDSEREFVEDYVSNNAKYQTNQKVLRKADHSSRWLPCFIGWRDVNRETWDIEYYTQHINKDGSPSKLRSSYPCSEGCIKPYK